MNTAFDKRWKLLKVCVIVPTYNNSATIASVVKDVLRFTENVIVVNDGSTDNTLQQLQPLPVTLVTYCKNKGKGFALQQGFKKAIECGYDYAITIDSDGQHFAADLPAFLEKLDKHGPCLIIGSRNMDQSSVPGKSSFGNKFSNFWFWVETGYRMNDTQSGYRLYPVRQLHDFRFFTTKYEFEIEVIVRAAWAGIDIVDVPVKVFYPDKEKRVSHFRPFKDFTRISILNTFLVLITFLYIKPRDFFRVFKKKSSVSLSGSTY